MTVCSKIDQNAEVSNCVFKVELYVTWHSVSKLFWKKGTRCNRGSTLSKCIPLNLIYGIFGVV